MKNRASLVVTVLISMVAVGYFSVQFCLLSDNMIKTQTIKSTLISEYADIELFALRVEKPIIKVNNYFVQTVDNCEKVSKGQSIGIYFNSNESMKSYFASTSKYETNYETNESQLNIDGLKDEISSDYQDMINEIYCGEFIKSAKSKESLLFELTEYDNTINGNAENNSLNQKISNSISGTHFLTADNTAYFVNYTDGFESDISTEDFLMFTKKDLENMYISGSETNNNSYIGKLVLSDKTYFAAIMKNEDCLQLKIGKNYSAFLAGGIKLSLNVEKFSQIEDERIVFFSTKDFNENIATIRKCECKLVINECVGAKIPQQAIQLVDNVLGVYVVEGNVVKFNKIEVMFDTPEYSACRLSSADGEIWEYDELVISGRKLYNGKYVKR